MTIQSSSIRESGWIVVTGCSSGIGECVATGLNERGYNVIATCRHQSDGDSLRRAGIDIVILDLAQRASVEQAIIRVREISGDKLYALVNNAAYGQPGAVIDLDRDVLRQQFEANVFGTQQLTNGLLPMMLAQGRGRVIQISSILGFICLRFRGAYNASKYALEALTDTMRLEHWESGVRFSLVEPGPIRSRFRENAYQKFKQNIDRAKSMFSDTYHRVEARLTHNKEARFTLPATAVLGAVIHALEHSNPKVRYPITVPTRVMSVLKRILTDRTMDRFLMANSDR